MMYPPGHSPATEGSPDGSPLRTATPDGPWHGPPPHRGPERRAPRPARREPEEGEGLDRRSVAPPAPTSRPPEPPETRTIGDRLEDALPLIVAAVAFGAIGLILRWYSPTTSGGRLEVWTLFVGLAIISGVGATVSFLLDDDDVPEEDQKVPPRATRDRASAPLFAERLAARSGSAPARVPRPSPRPLAEMPFADETLAGPSPLGSPPLGEEEERWLRPRPEHERPLWDETEEPTSDPVPPSQALDEIDRLWRDLERLRRVPGSR